MPTSVVGGSLGTIHHLRSLYKHVGGAYKEIGL